MKTLIYRITLFICMITAGALGKDGPEIDRDILVATSLPYLPSDAKCASLDKLVLAGNASNKARLLFNVVTIRDYKGYQMRLFESDQIAVIELLVSDPSGRVDKFTCSISSQTGTQIASAFQSYSRLAYINQIDDDLTSMQTCDSWTYVNAFRGSWIGLGAGYPNSWSAKIITVLNIMVGSCMRGGKVEMMEDAREAISELSGIFSKFGQEKYRLRRNRDFFIFKIGDIKGITDVVEVLSTDSILSANSRTKGYQQTDDKASPSGNGESPDNGHSAPRQPPESQSPAKPGSALK